LDSGKEIKNIWKKNLNSKINIGLIGCGRAAELIYSPALNKFPHIQVSGVVDPIAERRELISAKFKNCPGFSSAEAEFINQIDAAIITTPPDTHIPLASALLRNDKYVLVEKPLALTMEGIKELVEAESNSKAKLMMGLNHRYWLPAVRLRDKLSEQTKINFAQIVFTGDYDTWNPVSFISDPLNDLGPHVFDLIDFIFKKEIISVKAESADKKSIDVKVRIDSDLFIDCHIAHSSKTVKSIKIITSKENYFLELGSERLIPGPGGRRMFLDLKDKIDRKILGKSSPVKRTFELQLEKFFKLIESNKTECAGIKEGISSILAVNAVSASIKNNGKEICLNEIK